jgi:hypothetical protein
MKWASCTILLLVLTSPLVCANQEQQQDSAKPATKLESFQGKTGIVVVRGFTTIGMIRGIGGDITVDSREFRDASNPSARVSGISIAVRENGRLERENTSFIDADEIESLLKGIDYIAKASKDVTTMDQFEAEYRTKGNFSVTVFNQTNGETSVAVSSGRIGKTTVFIKALSLPELHTLIMAAESKL